MRTAVVSDLHLGALGGADVTRDPAVRERLIEALAGVDRVVLLGDALELRERPLAQALEVAAPLVEALGSALAGRTLVLVPGNHDHGLAEPWLSRLRLDGAELEPDGEWAVAPRTAQRAGSPRPCPMSSCGSPTRDCGCARTSTRPTATISISP